MPNPSKKVLSHFRDRSAKYNKSSNWVVDEKLLGRMFALAGIGGGETVLVRTGHHEVRETAPLELLDEPERHPLPDRLAVAPAVLFERYALDVGHDPQVVAGARGHRGAQVPLVP